jgi:RNA polymerase sigma-70 factor (ECF subfamily)
MIGKLLPFRATAKYGGMADDDLVAACAAGDVGAFEQLFRIHGPRVYRVVARLTPYRAEDIEDITQLTFLGVQQAAARFDGRSSVATWIVGIALNVVRHHTRGETRRRRLLEAVASTSAAASRNLGDEVADRELLARLAGAIDLLPEKLRVVYTLADLEGLRGRDVARTLRIPEGTVWRRLHHARARLRAAVEPGGSR